MPPRSSRRQKKKKKTEHSSFTAVPTITHISIDEELWSRGVALVPATSHPSAGRQACLLRECLKIILRERVCNPDTPSEEHVPGPPRRAEVVIVRPARQKTCQQTGQDREANALVKEAGAPCLYCKGIPDSAE